MNTSPLTLLVRTDRTNYNSYTIYNIAGCEYRTNLPYNSGFRKIFRRSPPKAGNSLYLVLTKTPIFDPKGCIIVVDPNMMVARFYPAAGKGSFFIDEFDIFTSDTYMFPLIRVAMASEHLALFTENSENFFSITKS